MVICLLQIKKEEVSEKFSAPVDFQDCVQDKDIVTARTIRPKSILLRANEVVGHNSSAKSLCQHFSEYLGNTTDQGDGTVVRDVSTWWFL